MKKHLHVLALLLVAVMLVSALAGCGGSGSSTPASGSGSTSAGEPADANPNAGRETVNIRFAQFGNSVDDVDGMENDPIKKAIEEAVNVTLEYDTGTDGFDERMQTELFTGGAADLFPTWGESEKISKWAEEDLVVNIAEIVNAEPDRYPTLYKIINSDEYKAYNKLYTGDENAAYAIYSVAASEHWTLATVSDEAKEVVKQLAEMYAAGGLDSGIGVKGDFDDAYSDFGAGKIASADFGFGYPGQFRDFYKTAWAAANDGAQMSDLTLGTSLTSDGNYGKTYTTGTWIGAHYFIPTTCENPDRVLDLVEYLASTEGQDLLHNTTNYEFRNDQGSDFWQPINKAYGYDDNRCKYVWFSYLLSGTEYEVNFADNDWWTAVSHPIDNSNEWATEEDAALVDYAKGIVSGFVDEAVEYLPAYYNLISLPSEAADIRTKLQDISNQYLTQMIGGQMDVETAWPNYVAEYEAAGAAELETMVNEAIATARAAA